MSTDALALNSSIIKCPAGKATTGLARRGVLKLLTRLQFGTLDITLPDGTRTVFGEQAEDGLHVAATIHDDRFFREVASGGSLGAAEAYLQGLWSTEDLTGLMRLMCRNLSRLESLETGLARVSGWVARAGHWLSRNTFAGSRRNISAHYDLSNEFFQLFLDPTLMYSSGLFEQSDMTMQQASVAKLDRICRKLDLRATDHVIEIGTGWGGWALHAARNYGCRITTTTISRKQYELAQQRIDAAGLSERVTILFEDYRNLEGEYDKLVSIEMIEAVGNAFLPAYFRKCDELLRPGGKMLVQGITMPDYRYAAYCRSVDFIQKYIFPGGHLPSVGAMQEATQQTKLLLVDALQFPDSYARTLQCWRREFMGRLDEVRALGFDDRFIRMWDYYLCYCEAAFLERSVSVGQFVWEKPRY